MKLIRIGFWKSGSEPSWPSPASFVDPSWDANERELVEGYLRDGMVVRTWMGPSFCRVCGQAVGTKDLSDGVYLWPEGLAHYVAVHSVRLPSSFVEHMNTRLDELDSLAVDDEWWKQQGS